MARHATARFTDGLSGWLRSALPGVVIDAPDQHRARRDHLVDLPGDHLGDLDREFPQQKSAHKSQRGSLIPLPA